MRQRSVLQREKGISWRGVLPQLFLMLLAIHAGWCWQHMQGIVERELLSTNTDEWALAGLEH